MIYAPTAPASFLQTSWNYLISEYSHKPENYAVTYFVLPAWKKKETELINRSNIELAET